MKKITKIMLAFVLLLTVLLVGCSKSDEVVTEENTEPTTLAVFAPGTYIGEAEGHAGPIKVAVTVDETNILSIEIQEFNDSEFSLEPRDAMIDKIIKANTADVDTVSGATVTTTGVKEAVQNALNSAYVNGNAASNAATTDDNAKEYEDITTQVLVIGGGGAGLSAAISAKENGSDVVLIEKLAFLGGNTNYATGGLNASETLEQEALGIEDSDQTFFDDTMTGGKNINNPELVKVLTTESKNTVRWLTDLGADLTDVGILGGSTNKRSHRPTGGAPVGNHIVSVLSDNANEMGVEILLSTKATKLIVENNEVVGVEVATDDGGTYTIFADAVVIATGGFGANNDLVASYVPEYKGYGTTNAPGATGDVFDITEGLDIALVDIDQIQTHPTVMPSNNYMITEAVRGTGAILVNREGQRFINELETRDVVSDAELSQTGESAFLVFDQNVRDNLSAINGYYEKGYLIEAQTIEELAEKLGTPVEELTNTISTYNGYVNSGVDADFARESMESTVEMAPFYAIEVAPAIHHTMGGVKIDTDTHVYTNNGEYINGLFAAGEVTGGVHGANRLGGNAMADITVFGKIAGQNASQYVAGK